MAEDQETNKVTGNVSREVPWHLEEFLRSRVLHHINKAKEFSTVIKQTEGQDSAKFVINCGKIHENVRTVKTDGLDRVKEAELHDKTANAILVGNIPPAANEDILEVFFESKKKGAGKPVKNIQLNKRKHWAIITFDESEAVENVIRKKPIRFMNVELPIFPYTPLIPSVGCIDGLEIQGLHKELSEDLIAKDIEEKVGSAEVSSAEYISEDDTEESDKESGEENDNANGEIVEQITDIHPVKVRMLTTLQDEEEPLEMFHNAKMKINKRKNEIYFYGSVADIQPLKLYVYKKLSSFSVYTFRNISPSSIKLFNSLQLADHIRTELSARKLTCSWETEGNALVICSPEEYITECCSVVRESVKETTFCVCNESAASFLSTEWQRKRDELHKKFDFVCNVNPMQKMIEVHVVAKSDMTDLLAEDIKTFVKQQARTCTETIDLRSLGKEYDGICDLGLDKKLVRRIIKDLEMYHVSLESGFDYFNSCRIKGTVEGRELLKERIRNLNL